MPGTSVLRYCQNSLPDRIHTGPGRNSRSGHFSSTEKASNSHLFAGHGDEQRKLNPLADRDCSCTALRAQATTNIGKKHCLAVFSGKRNLNEAFLKIQGKEK